MPKIVTLDPRTLPSEHRTLVNPFNLFIAERKQSEECGGSDYFKKMDIVDYAEEWRNLDESDRIKYYEIAEQNRAKLKLIKVRKKSSPQNTRYVVKDARKVLKYPSNAFWQFYKERRKSSKASEWIPPQTFLATCASEWRDLDEDKKMIYKKIFKLERKEMKRKRRKYLQNDILSDISDESEDEQELNMKSKNISDKSKKCHLEPPQINQTSNHSKSSKKKIKSIIPKTIFSNTSIVLPNDNTTGRNRVEEESNDKNTIRNIVADFRKKESEHRALLRAKRKRLQMKKQRREIRRLKKLKAENNSKV